MARLNSPTFTNRMTSASTRAKEAAPDTRVEAGGCSAHSPSQSPRRNRRQRAMTAPCREGEGSGAPSARGTTAAAEPRAGPAAGRSAGLVAAEDKTGAGTAPTAGRGALEEAAKPARDPRPRTGEAGVGAGAWDWRRTDTGEGPSGRTPGGKGERTAARQRGQVAEVVCKLVAMQA
eukprot:jgi/Mesvir1/4978/Mv02838-RA.1